MHIQVFVEMPPDPCPACGETVELARKLRRNYTVDLIDVNLQRHNRDAQAWDDATGGHVPAIRLIREDEIEWIRGKSEVLRFKETMEGRS